MYEIHIESEEFREKRTVQQHQMVNQVRGARGRPRSGTVCLFMCVCECVYSRLCSVCRRTRRLQHFVVGCFMPVCAQR